MYNWKPPIHHNISLYGLLYVSVNFSNEDHYIKEVAVQYTDCAVINLI
jgi:hypothetical protein